MRRESILERMSGAMNQYLLGIDIGTSACKIAIFDEDGQVKASASGDYKVYYPHPGWAEQNPEEWWQAVCGAVKGALEKGGIRPGEIAGIGIDGQSWSAIPIDKEGNVLANTPIWMDTRAADICEEVGARIGEDRIFEVCGNPFKPSYTTPKILWYQRNLPDVYKKMDKILQSNSYIAFKLTGEVTQELSQGYGHHCFRMRTGEWDMDMCKELGINPDILPEIYASHAVVGTVTKQAAEECGLIEGIPVVAGALDAACGTLGAGVIHPIGALAVAYTRFPVDEAYITLYLDQWDETEERWRQVNYYDAEFYSADYPDGLILPTVDISFVDQPRGYYYRLRSSFSVVYKGEFEGFSPVTDGILLD